MTGQNNRYIKILALLSSVRWYNIILIASAQYLSAIFVFNSFPESLILVLFDFKLHLLVICTLLISAAGFLLNDFYDFKYDLMVRPRVTLFQQYVSKDLRLRLYVLFNAFAFLIAILASFQIFIYFFVLSFGLWFYSHKLKNYPLLKEITASLLTISCFFSVGLHYFMINLDIIVYGFYFLFLLFTRYLIKGVEEIKGDIALNKNSLTLVLGKDKTRFLIKFSILVHILYSVFILIYFNQNSWVYYIIFSGVLLVAVFISLHRIRDGEFYLLNFIYKILIVLGIVNLMFL
jgi:4-hydroxybenzoate polyprenyltransferase